MKKSRLPREPVCSGEHQIGSATTPDSPPITILLEPAPSVQQPAPAENAESETTEPIDSKPSSAGGRLNLSLPPPSRSSTVNSLESAQSYFCANSAWMIHNFLAARGSCYLSILAPKFCE